MQTAVIHACKIGEHEVLATGEHVSFYPPPRMGPDTQDAFVHFDIEWNQGMYFRNGFLVKVDKSQGDVHYDLVVDGENLETARVGLRQWVSGKSDPDGRILWA